MVTSVFGTLYLLSGDPLGAAVAAQEIDGRGGEETDFRGRIH